MANGFYGDKAEWERIEGPLRSLDATLQAFASRYNIKLTRNDRHWPDRSLEWGDPIRRLLQIYYLADTAEPLYNDLPS